ncbi:unnamed protein product [Leptidea sinapis]|uniref:Uncharacterized protein n=1 Tax=Leptidea sinapis TaxID=189913 RepID=A0A5E4R2S3_9NEOP|nr:unnamed protein product [Leptidea sinapis]
MRVARGHPGERLAGREAERRPLEDIRYSLEEDALYLKIPKAGGNRPRTISQDQRDAPQHAPRLAHAQEAGAAVQHAQVLQAAQVGRGARQPRELPLEVGRARAARHAPVGRQRAHGGQRGARPLVRHQHAGRQAPARRRHHALQAGLLQQLGQQRHAELAGVPLPERRQPHGRQRPEALRHQGPRRLGRHADDALARRADAQRHDFGDRFEQVRQFLESLERDREWGAEVRPIRLPETRDLHLQVRREAQKLDGLEREVQRALPFLRSGNVPRDGKRAVRVHDDLSRHLLHELGESAHAVAGGRERSVDDRLVELGYLVLADGPAALSLHYFDEISRPAPTLRRGRENTHDNSGGECCKQLRQLGKPVVGDAALAPEVMVEHGNQPAEQINYIYIVHIFSFVVSSNPMVPNKWRNYRSLWAIISGNCQHTSCDSVHSELYRPMPQHAVDPPGNCRINIVIGLRSAYASERGFIKDAFNEFLELNLNLNVPLKTKEEVDDACLYITNLTQVAAWFNTLELKDASREAAVPLAVKEKIAPRCRLRRIWQTNHKTEDKTRKNRAFKLKDLLDPANTPVSVQQAASVPLQHGRVDEHGLQDPRAVLVHQLGGGVQLALPQRAVGGRGRGRHVQQLHHAAVALVHQHRVPHPQQVLRGERAAVAAGVLVAQPRERQRVVVLVQQDGPQPRPQRAQVGGRRGPAQRQLQAAPRPRAGQAPLVQARDGQARVALRAEQHAGQRALAARAHPHAQHRHVRREQLR